MSSGALIVAALAASGTASVAQGLAAQAQGRANQRIAEYNAAMAERQGKAQMEAARLNSERLARQQRLAMGQNIAAAAKSGISLSGSVLDVLADTAYQYQLDRNLILTQGLNDYQTGSQRASLLRSEGKFSAAQGRSNALWAYLNGVSSVALGLASLRSMNSAASAMTTSTTGS
ncbi:MAG TPA: hypothetical protein PK052_07395 [Anaerohalosphaeraceae bacterium]|nr:hypothetical protein [Anaerohalosphaeraceae bacterium]HPC65001.1 hypothetical protein [Anaerohalosphaeraceae bacterium]